MNFDGNDRNEDGLRDIQSPSSPFYKNTFNITAVITPQRFVRFDFPRF